MLKLVTKKTNIKPTQEVFIVDIHIPDWGKSFEKETFEEQIP